MTSTEITHILWNLKVHYRVHSNPVSLAKKIQSTRYSIFLYNQF